MSKYFYCLKSFKSTAQVNAFLTRLVLLDDLEADLVSTFSVAVGLINCLLLLDPLFFQNSNRESE